jgi:hypothetical protein
VQGNPLASDRGAAPDPRPALRGVVVVALVVLGPIALLAMPAAAKTKTKTTTPAPALPNLKMQTAEQRVAPHEGEVVAQGQLLDGMRDAAGRAAVDHDQAVRRRGGGEQCGEHVGPRRVRFTGHDDDRARGCLDVHSARSGT